MDPGGRRERLLPVSKDVVPALRAKGVLAPGERARILRQSRWYRRHIRLSLQEDRRFLLPLTLPDPLKGRGNLPA